MKNELSKQRFHFFYFRWKSIQDNYEIFQLSAQLIEILNMMDLCQMRFFPASQLRTKGFNDFESFISEECLSPEENHRIDAWIWNYQCQRPAKIRIEIDAVVSQNNWP